MPDDGSDVGKVNTYDEACDVLEPNCTEVLFEFVRMTDGVVTDWVAIAVAVFKLPLTVKLERVTCDGYAAVIWPVESTNNGCALEGKADSNVNANEDVCDPLLRI